MVYRESLWLAAAAASPVIALANTVSMIDVTSVWLGSKSQSMPSFLRHLYFGVNLLSIFNLLLQALVLYRSAESLAQGKNLNDPTEIPFLLLYGLLVVLVSTFGSIFFRYILRYAWNENGQGEEKGQVAKGMENAGSRHRSSGLGWPTIPPSLGEQGPACCDELSSGLFVIVSWTLVSPPASGA
jgi:hypothetical protein